ncbi:unnamed protein product, partial [Leptidea sinapis]
MKGFKNRGFKAVEPLEDLSRKRKFVIKKIKFVHIFSFVSSTLKKEYISTNPKYSLRKYLLSGGEGSRLILLDYLTKMAIKLAKAKITRNFNKFNLVEVFYIDSNVGLANPRRVDTQAEQSRNHDGYEYRSEASAKKLGGRYSQEEFPSVNNNKYNGENIIIANNGSKKTKQISQRLSEKHETGVDLGHNIPSNPIDDDGRNTATKTELNNRGVDERHTNIDQNIDSRLDDAINQSPHDRQPFTNPPIVTKVTEVEERDPFRGESVKDEAWVWGETSATTTMMDLDDRSSLTGDKCPTGKARVKGNLLLVQVWCSITSYQREVDRKRLNADNSSVGLNKIVSNTNASSIIIEKIEVFSANKSSDGLVERRLVVTEKVQTANVLNSDKWMWNDNKKMPVVFENRAALDGDLCPTGKARVADGRGRVTTDGLLSALARLRRPPLPHPHPHPAPHTRNVDITVFKFQSEFNLLIFHACIAVFLNDIDGNSKTRRMGEPSPPRSTHLELPQNLPQ